MHDNHKTTPRNTSGPSTPKPKGPEAAPAEGGLTPSPEAARDFDQARRALEQIRSAEAMVIALIATLPDAAEMRVQVVTMRDELLRIRRKLMAATTACREIGLPL